MVQAAPTQKEKFSVIILKKQITFILTSEFLLLYFSENKTTDRQTFPKMKKIQILQCGLMHFHNQTFLLSYTTALHE